jgi:hypothetical protein
MITTTQQALQQLYDAGRITCGNTYNMMPTGCRGDGFDIAYTPRDDESGEYALADGTICSVSCAVKIGSSNWSHGIPIGYTLSVYRQAPQIIKERPTDRPYVLIRFVSLANGSWKWVHGTRGYYRAVHIDPSKGNASGLARAKGTMAIIAQSQKIDSGTARRPAIAYAGILAEAKAYAAQHNLPIVQ